MNGEFINPSSAVEYGPSLTFGDPRLYLRLGERAINKESSYQEILDTINLAFDPRSPDSVIPRLSPELALGPNIRVLVDLMNHGNDSLVYLASITDGEKTENFTVLVNQPRRELGSAKREYQNLLRLAEIDPRFVVKPIAYLQNENQELYITPYIENARCIYGGRHRWGVYDPVPHYHFTPLSNEVANAVNSSMISVLAHYYDHERGEGLAKTQLSGDDFIIQQGWNIILVPII